MDNTKITYLYGAKHSHPEMSCEITYIPTVKIPLYVTISSAILSVLLWSAGILLIGIVCAMLNTPQLSIPLGFAFGFWMVARILD